MNTLKMKHSLHIIAIAFVALSLNPGIDTVGALMTVYGIANPPVSFPTPIPMDFFSNEYTVAVTGMTVDSFVADPVFSTKDFLFTGGTLRIYGDSIATGTAGDFANPSTFTDGEMLLEYNVDPGWMMHMDNPMGPPFGWYSGAGIGACDVTGGTQMAALIAAEYNLANWTFGGTGISEASMFDAPEPGYEYIFGVKVVFPYDPTPNEDTTWSEVKTLFR
jgi:hypothetical protein